MRLRPPNPPPHPKTAQNGMWIGEFGDTLGIKMNSGSFWPESATAASHPPFLLALQSHPVKLCSKGGAQKGAPSPTPLSTPYGSTLGPERGDAFLRGAPKGGALDPSKSPKGGAEMHFVVTWGPYDASTPRRPLLDGAVYNITAPSQPKGGAKRGRLLWTLRVRPATRLGYLVGLCRSTKGWGFLKG